MKLPGFSAGAAVYRSSVHYRSVSGWSGGVSGFSPEAQIYPAALCTNQIAWAIADLACEEANIARAEGCYYAANVAFVACLASGNPLACILIALAALAGCETASANQLAACLQALKGAP